MISAFALVLPDSVQESTKTTTTKMINARTPTPSAVMIKLSSNSSLSKFDIIRSRVLMNRVDRIKPGLIYPNIQLMLIYLKVVCYLI
jgi:UTP-glucose-1-phosphate uridylyltransferase